MFAVYHYLLAWPLLKHKSFRGPAQAFLQCDKACSRNARAQRACEPPGAPDRP